MPAAVCIASTWGPYTSRVDAEKIAERIRLALGYKPTFVTR
jgi:hypothetical protein